MAHATFEPLSPRPARRCLRRRRRRGRPVAALLLWLAACSPPQAAPAVTGAQPTALRAKAAGLRRSVAAPALRAPQQARVGAGQVLAAPRVVLVALGNPSDAQALQTFLGRWQASAAWPAMVAEYGVGALEVLPLRQQASPFVSPLRDEDDDSNEAETSPVEALVAELAQDDPQAGRTVYVLVLPEGLVASPTRAHVDGCAAHLWAWHSAAEVAGVAGVQDVPYVVLPNCPASGSTPVLDLRTAALSHAIVQAVTNPSRQAVAGLDAAHAATELLAENGEVGTLCTQALHGSATWLTRPEDVGFAVARVWSNAASLAGTMPCVPAAADEPFFQADVALHDKIRVQFGGGNRAVTTRGVRLQPGHAAVLPLHFVAANPREPSWNVVVEELGSHDLTLQLDHAQGMAGDVAQLSLRLADAPERDRYVVRVTAQRGGLAYSNYFLVQRTGAL